MVRREYFAHFDSKEHKSKLVKNSEVADYIAENSLSQTSKADSESQSDENVFSTMNTVDSNENITTDSCDLNERKKVSGSLALNEAAAEPKMAKSDLPNSKDEEFDRNIFSLIDSLSGTKLSSKHREIDEVCNSQKPSDTSDNNTKPTIGNFFKLSSLRPSCEDLVSVGAKSTSSNEAKQLSSKSNQNNGPMKNIIKKNTPNKKPSLEREEAISSNKLNEKRKLLLLNSNIWCFVSFLNFFYSFGAESIFQRGLSS